MTETEKKLLTALWAAVYDMHPTYPSTTGWRGGPGGQTLTRGCTFNSPPPESEYAELQIEHVLRTALDGLEGAEIGTIATAAAELIKAPTPPEGRLGDNR